MCNEGTDGWSILWWQRRSLIRLLFRISKHGHSMQETLSPLITFCLSEATLLRPFSLAILSQLSNCFLQREVVLVNKPVMPSSLRQEAGERGEHGVVCMVVEAEFWAGVSCCVCSVCTSPWREGHALAVLLFAYGILGNFRVVKSLENIMKEYILLGAHRSLF